MKVEKWMVLAVLILSLVCINGYAEDESDTAVTAAIDMPMFGLPTNSTNMLNPAFLEKQINPFPTTEQLRWFDMNRDLQVNEFDVKQLENIIASLNGESLSGLQLTIRFRSAQKNQRDNFPILYDLDQDGMFTAFDVDHFTGIVNSLDQGASRGNELIQRLKNQLRK